MLWSLLMGLPLLAAQLSGYDNPDLTSFLTMVGYSFPFVFVINEFQRRVNGQGETPHTFRFDSISVYLFLVLVPVTIAIGLVNEQIAVLIPGTEALEEMMNDMLTPSTFTFFTVVLCAPILEEILFRGILLDRFLRYMSPGSAIFWSSLFFGGVHMIPAQVVSAFLAGLFIGWLYWRTRSLWACMLVHSVNNLLSYGMFVYYGDITTNEIIDQATLIKVLSISVLLLICGIWIIHRRTTVTETNNSISRKAF